MLSRNGKKSRPKKTKHINSSPINQLVSDIKSLEKELKRVGIAIAYPDQEHEHTPMIGHTKGNTSSNRKVIKKHQRQELERIVAHLVGILPNGETFISMLRSGSSPDSDIARDVLYFDSDDSISDVEI